MVWGSGGSETPSLTCDLSALEQMIVNGCFTTDLKPESLRPTLKE